MADKLHPEITGIEKQLKQHLEEFFLSVYPEDHLESHGIEHHRRVWSYACDLIAMKADPELLTASFLKNLIIACYLHDIGMAEDHGFNHGLTGRRKCSEFLSSRNLDPQDFTSGMEAIEYHDNKDYNMQHSGNKVLHILSLADDLDAYGYTGIYRYTDIYLRRDIGFADLGKLVRKNAAGRYARFISETDLPVDYKSRQEIRYRILDDFFAGYEQEVNSYKFAGNEPSGYCGVVQTVLFAIKSREDVKFLNILHEYSNDDTINWYLKGYLSEIKD